MIISELSSFDRYEDFIQKITRSDLYKDPHDVNNIYDSLSKPNRKAYLIESDNHIILGIFVWLIIEQEKYVELLFGLSKQQEAFSFMLDYLEKRYYKYQFDFVINPNNEALKNVLVKRKASFDKPQHKMVCEKFVDYIIKNKAVLLTKGYEKQYCLLHDDNVYWTSERILKAKDKFRIFVLIIEERLVGYLEVTYCFEENEVYSLWVDNAYSNQGNEQALLLSALETNPGKSMMVLVDKDSSNEIKIYESVGFRKISGSDFVYATYTSVK